jgi:hypothetical protein
MEWISVGEALPEDRGVYLVSVTDEYNKTDVVMGAFVDSGKYLWDADCIHKHEVTHWMPLPGPPVEHTEEA